MLWHTYQHCTVSYQCDQCAPHHPFIFAGQSTLFKLYKITFTKHCSIESDSTTILFFNVGVSQSLSFYLFGIKHELFFWPSSLLRVPSPFDPLTRAVICWQMPRVCPTSFFLVDVFDSSQASIFHLRLPLYVCTLSLPCKTFSEDFYYGYVFLLLHKLVFHTIFDSKSF